MIELLVVLGIITILAGIVFSGQSNFNATVILSSTAYDVALSMRDAETYGLSTEAQGAVSNAGYGLDFNSHSPGSYILFADSYPPAGVGDYCHPLPANGASAPNAYPGSCAYNSNDVVVSTYQVGNSVTITNFCGYNGSWECSTTCSGVGSCTTGLSQLDIVFLRPNATPFISEGGVYQTDPAVTSACITLSSGGNSRFITLAASGQIIASASACP